MSGKDDSVHAQRGRAAFRRLTRSHDRGTVPPQGGQR